MRPTGDEFRDAARDGPVALIALILRDQRPTLSVSLNRPLARQLVFALRAAGYLIVPDTAHRLVPPPRVEEVRASLIEQDAAASRLPSLIETIALDAVVKRAEENVGGSERRADEARLARRAIDRLAGLPLQE